jgi:hypothetical protein
MKSRRGLCVSDEWSPWRAATRAQVLTRVTTWMRDPFEVFQVAKGKDHELLAVVKHERVAFMDLAHCSRETSVLWSLVHHQFPQVILSGAFFFRQVANSDDWSDHAWGTAIDTSPRGMTNDELFDWVVRTCRERIVDADYIIGSIDGKVRSASAPGFDIVPSGAAVSHTWHVHTSVVDHDGAKPPRNPMFK